MSEKIQENMAKLKDALKRTTKLCELMRTAEDAHQVLLDLGDCIGEFSTLESIEDYKVYGILSILRAEYILANPSYDCLGKRFMDSFVQKDRSEIESILTSYAGCKDPSEAATIIVGRTNILEVYRSGLRSYEELFAETQISMLAHFYRDGKIPGKCIYECGTMRYLESIKNQ